MLKILLSFLLSIRMFGTMFLSSSYEKYIFWFYKRSPVHFLLLNVSESYAAPKTNLDSQNILEPLFLTQLSSIRQKLISNAELVTVISTSRLVYVLFFFSILHASSLGLWPIVVNLIPQLFNSASLPLPLK